MAILLGLDPGLRKTGWGVIRTDLNKMTYIASGTIQTDDTQDLAQRLLCLKLGLDDILKAYEPHQAAVEEVFVNKNPASTLKLGMARGVVMLTPALYGVPVYEYPATLVKKSLVGSGHADKIQVMAMIKILMPLSQVDKPDEADALAVAICHAHHQQTQHRIGGVATGAWAGARK